MKITKANYEAYLLDLLEGRLSSEERGELMAFLEAHPELEADFDLLDATLPNDDAPAAADRKRLKADGEAPEALDWLMARALEGDAEELPEFSKGPNAKHWEAMKRTKLEAQNEKAPDLSVPNEIESPELLAAAVAEGDVDNALSAKLMQDGNFAREVETYQKLRMQPAAVTYPHKAGLKKAAPVVPLYRQFAARTAAVAAIGLALLAGWWYTNTPPQPAKPAITAERNLKTEREVQQNSAAETDAVDPFASTDRDAAKAADANNVPDNAVAVSTTEDRGSIPRGIETQGVDQSEEVRFANVSPLTRRRPALLRREKGNDERTLTLPVQTLLAVDMPKLPPREQALELPERAEWQAYLLDRAKQEVLGRPQKEDETFTEALAMRVEEKTDGNVQVAPKGTGSNRFYLKIGKFSIER